MDKLTDQKRELLQMKEYITKFYTLGVSLRQLSEWYNTSPGSIRTLLIEEGVKMRQRGRRKKEK